jgi:large subunit ribosomal protein L30
MPRSRKAVRVAAVEQPASEPEETPAAAVETPAETPAVETPVAVTHVAEAPVAEAAVEGATGPILRVTLLRSGTGHKYDQKRTLAALGLRTLNQTVERPDNASVRGMVAKVQHLVRVEEIGQA